MNTAQRPPASPTTTVRVPRRQARYIEVVPTITNEGETIQDRTNYLRTISQDIQNRVKLHLDSESRGVVAMVVPPGAGKSTATAELGMWPTPDVPGRYNLAWIAERHNMIENVEALGYYRHIQACNKHNCPDYLIHQYVAHAGYNSWSIHSQHTTPCSYARQFTEEGSAVYQMAHVRTTYPSTHEGIIIDEMDLAKWLPERAITMRMLQKAAQQEVIGSYAHHLLVATQAALDTAEREGLTPHGLDLYTILDTSTGSTLYDLMSRLRNDRKYANTRPHSKIKTDDPQAEEQAANLTPVVLPHLISALDQELFKWDEGRGTQWNSRLRLGNGSHGYALYITEPLTFTPGDNGLPVRVILDATADEELLSLHMGEEITLERAHVDPPQGMQHIAVRTGKRYGKTSLCFDATKPRERQKSREANIKRVVAECRYLLHEYDPDGSKASLGKIGIISYMGCVNELAEALNIPESVTVDGDQRERRGHFWNMRGSNQMEDCEILFVVGTPTLQPAELHRLARALWHEDPNPIDEKRYQDPITSEQVYRDARLARLSAYLIRAELTQCAHRSRALRHSGRIVFTLCNSDIDHLPTTRIYKELPQLLADGRERWSVSREVEEAKLDTALQALVAQGIKATVRGLKATAHVGTAAAQEYLQKRRVNEAVAVCNDHVLQGTEGVTPPKCSLSVFVPDSAIDTIYSKTRYIAQNEAAPRNVLPLVSGAIALATSSGVPQKAQRGTETTPPSCGEACARCGHIDDWVRHRGVAPAQWVCSCYYWWYEHPEWRLAQQQSLLVV